MGLIYGCCSYITSIGKITTQADENGIRQSQIDLKRFKYNIESPKNDQTPVVILYIHQKNYFEH